MNHVLRTMAIAALLLAGLTMNAQAGERGPRAKGDGPKPGMSMGPLAGLNLTPEQKQKMEQIHEAAAKQAEPLHKELAAKMKEMQALWAVDKPDRAAIERKHGEMSAITSKLWGVHIDAKLQIHAILTPEQRAKWASHADEGPGMHGMHGPGMPCMHGGECGMNGGDCPCMHGSDCPCMQGGGPAKASKPEKK